MKSRNCARLTTAQVVGSTVITDAERGAPSSDISPTYSPGPWKSMTNSRPASLLAKTFTRPDSTMIEGVADVALVDQDRVLGKRPDDARRGDVAQRLVLQRRKGLGCCGRIHGRVEAVGGAAMLARAFAAVRVPELGAPARRSRRCGPVRRLLLELAQVVDHLAVVGQLVRRCGT